MKLWIAKIKELILPLLKNKRVLYIAAASAAALILLIVLLIVLLSGKAPEPAVEETTQATTTAPTEGSKPTEPEAPTEPEQPQEPTMLPNFEELYAQNQDTAGWLKIEGTVIDYPVVHVPGDNEKYVHTNFEGNWEYAGTLFIDGSCSIYPETDNILIHGHNMKNDTMFGSLVRYQKKSYWESHQKIQFSTLYEEREYEIVAVFFDRVYYSYEDCFKYYEFIDAEDEEDFNAAMAEFKKKSLYDTGVTAQYGDNILTLVTCSYHIPNGRFVVVARATSGE